MTETHPEAKINSSGIRVGQVGETGLCVISETKADHKYWSSSKQLCFSHFKCPRLFSIFFLNYQFSHNASLKMYVALVVLNRFFFSKNLSVIS